MSTGDTRARPTEPMTVQDKTHAEAKRMDSDDITAYGRDLDVSVEYTGPTVEVELPARLAFDTIHMANHLFDTWGDDQCNDDAYMRAASAVVFRRMMQALKYEDVSLDDLDGYARALDRVRGER